MTTLLFIGDIVGEAGLLHLEARFPALLEQYTPDFVIANAENIALSDGRGPRPGAGMSPGLLERLFALGVDLVTGGNHSWDGPHGYQIHHDARILRPLNFGQQAPGRGAAIIDKNGVRLGVINVMSATAMRGADVPLDAVEHQLSQWAERVDAVLVDFHGESVTEKVTMGFALAGRVTAVLGTHTHVQTRDTRLLPGGTAYVSDVGMTGPDGGIQGYDPGMFVNSMRLRLPSGEPLEFASGAVEMGAVLVTFSGGRAQSIDRVE